MGTMMRLPQCPIPLNDRASKPTSRKTKQSRSYLYYLKIMTKCRKMALCIGTNVTGWTAIRSTHENLAEHLERDTEHLHQHRATRPPLAILPPWKTSA